MVRYSLNGYWNRRTWHAWASRRQQIQRLRLQEVRIIESHIPALRLDRDDWGRPSGKFIAGWGSKTVVVIAGTYDGYLMSLRYRDGTATMRVETLTETLIATIYVPVEKKHASSVEDLQAYGMLRLFKTLIANLTPEDADRNPPAAIVAAEQDSPVAPGV